MREVGEHFSFTHQDKPGRLREEQLRVVSEQPDIDTDQLARWYLRGIDTGRGGTIKTDLARFQNEIARGIVSGGVPNKERLFRDIRRAVGSGERYTKDLEGTFSSIENLVAAINKVRQEFERAREQTPHLQEVISLNEMLDAAHGIDLVDIYYEDMPSGSTRIQDVRFVQVKSAQVPQAKVHEIEDQHLAYLDSLASVEQVAGTRQRVETQEYLTSGQYFGEKYPRDKDRAAQIEFLSDYFSDFILEMITHDGPVNEEDVMSWAASSGIDLGVIKLFFGDLNRAIPLVELVAHATDEPVAYAKEKLKALNQWITHPGNSVTPEELRGMYPDWRLNPNVAEVPNFYSVVLHGGKESVRRLTPKTQGPKVLTRR